MSQFPYAMAAVNRQDDDAVAGGDPGANFVRYRPPPPRRPEAKLIENMDKALKDAQAFSDVHWAVNRAIKRGERDVTDPTIEDSEALRKIYAIIRNVQGTAI